MSRIKADSPHIYFVIIIVAVVAIKDIPNPSKTHKRTHKAHAKREIQIYQLPLTEA